MTVRKYTWVPMVGPVPLDHVVPNRKKAHIKSAANVVVGIMVSMSILLMFGVPFKEGLSIQAIIMATTYLRTYLIEITVERLL